ncbi:MAG: hypothetical protein JW969_15080, partial [Spirochaetales bacterium]|nr:hypothetical protein [Spirochaetales bacterium]
MKKYFHVLSLSMKNQINYLPSFLVQNVFFVLIIFIMYCLWSVIYSGKPVIEGLTLTQTIWYLTFTEAVELSRSNILKDMQVQVKDGSIAYMMGRPYSYVFYNLFEALGHSLIKLGPILCAGFILGVVFCGMLPGYFTHLPFGLVLFTGGLVLKILWCINIA